MARGPLLVLAAIQSPTPTTFRISMHRNELSKDIFVSQADLLKSEMDAIVFSPSSKNRVFRATEW
jgi:hypothetical protein